MFYRCIALLTGLFTVCVGAHASPSDLRLIVARTAAESGVVDKIVDEFQKKHRYYKVTLTATGGLNALNMARAGQADALITHIPRVRSSL